MTFFLIVPSVMIISVILIHGILNRVGLKIHYASLMICAALSILSDVGSILLSPAPDKFYFIRLAGFVIISAMIGTLANYFLVKRENRLQAEFSEQVRTAYEEKTDLIVVESEPEEKIEPEPIKKVEPVKEVSLIKKSEPIKKVKKVESVKIEQPEKIIEEKISEPKAEVKTVKKFEPEKIVRSVKKVEVADKKPADKPVEKIEDKPAEKVTEHVLPASVENLDEMLDYAYSEKSKGHTWQAISAYKKALEKYRNDEYAPFIAIDLGNVYKEQAMYAKAITIYGDALELPAVKRNLSTQAEFKKNIAYLRAVQSVLLRHKALTTPFSKISRIYLQEIESEFQLAQLK